MKKSMEHFPNGTLSNFHHFPWSAWPEEEVLVNLNPRNWAAEAGQVQAVLQPYLGLKQ